MTQLDDLKSEVRQRRNEATAKRKRLDGYREGVYKGKVLAYGDVVNLIGSTAEADADRPTEWTYRQYRETVERHAEAILDELEEYPDEFDSIEAAIANSVDHSHTLIYPGWALAAVLLSDQDPDHPDYCEPWTAYADLTDPTWPDVVGAMARACLYSDVFDHLKRCPDCSGIGRVMKELDDVPAVDAECETCDGSGERDLEALTGATV